ncbi:hypothetical protein LAUMK136_00839 [Mycobacterium attenuatum]|uniref:Beta-barrel assembly-enhancing protease n=1 Tax=Mycobacterium attenuatum TaxID=2341086 RepID=A0A498PSZ5_9MYCO|nr:hypothetical protein LAUMK136_00839 [Mycobacterium attenuatum]
MIHDERPGWTKPGALVPLEEQDRQRWDRGRIARGLDRLRQARGSTGPYLPQAVIAALHATAPSWEQTDWTTICAAYDRLVQLTNSPVILANPALAVGFRDGPGAGLAALEQVAHDPRLARSNLVASVRADLLRRAGRRTEAVDWYRKALDANGSEPGRAFLRRRIAECGGRSCRADAKAPDTPEKWGLLRLLAQENQASAKLRVIDGSTGMPGPVVVDTVIFFR